VIRLFLGWVLPVEWFAPIPDEWFDFLDDLDLNELYPL
jgi:hypothetical protein